MDYQGDHMNTMFDLYNEDLINLRSTIAYTFINSNRMSLKSFNGMTRTIKTRALELGLSQEQLNELAREALYMPNEWKCI